MPRLMVVHGDSADSPTNRREIIAQSPAVSPHVSASAKWKRDKKNNWTRIKIDHLGERTIRLNVGNGSRSFKIKFSKLRWKAFPFILRYSLAPWYTRYRLHGLRLLESDGGLFISIVNPPKWVTIGSHKGSLPFHYPFDWFLKVERSDRVVWMSFWWKSLMARRSGSTLQMHGARRCLPWCLTLSSKHWTALV